MAQMIFSQTYSPDQKIFAMGDEGRNAYFIERGRVQVSLPKDDGETIIAELGKGEIFGEMSMIDDVPRSATVTAVEDTEVIVIQRSRFIQPLKSAHPMMNLLLRIVLARFRDAQRQLSGMRTTSSEMNTSLEEIRSLAFDRINTERDMRRGLDAGEFEMHYQPITSLDGGHIAGFEALMRWRKDDGGFVSPVEFIPLAEETGLIVELGRWALETSLKEQKNLAGRFNENFPAVAAPFMSVNVSGLQLSELSEIDRLADIIDASGTPPGDIKLEITETLMVENFDHAKAALDKLKDLGVLIAIDDFGTGYSSLSYLHQLPFDTLKIDRVFVTNMDKSESSQRIVRSIAQLALALDMNIVAEGIEEQAQMDALRDLGCQYGQGFFMSKPLTTDAAHELIDSKATW
ncbi:MAG: EAL domain-containing protein [Rhodospirillaceae bacterium]|nr:EAL domain-containing protein [Rhodospirillaceae bacterium]MBT7509269.1 EAL domain-containing protein [Rhodospirillaceae bacterium]